MSEARTALEDKVVEAARAARDQVVGLLEELVACDTTARMPGDPARDEEKLQRLLAARLAGLGARPDLWEPAPTGAGSRSIPAGLDFAGRPQLAAVVPGAGSGRSLLLNGHIDAVDVEPRAEWLSDPFKVDRRDGFLYGRGVNDMKGGIACMIVALETLHRLGVRLAGDAVFCTVTDEESSGAGGHMAVAHGVRADAGIAAEATDFDAWVSCRGTVTPTITVAGRAGHAEMTQPDWREGGAVNAIEKLAPLLAGIQALREEWRGRADHRHPLLAPGDIVPTIVHGGTWIVTYPASCDLTCDITYLPAHVDAEGTGRAVEAEVIDRLTTAVAGDPWFAEHPLALHLERRCGAGRDAGRPPARHHGAPLRPRRRPDRQARRPRQLARRRHVHRRRHADLQLRAGRYRQRPRRERARVRWTVCVDFTAAIALTAMRWCGVA